MTGARCTDNMNRINRKGKRRKRIRRAERVAACLICIVILCGSVISGFLIYGIMSEDAVYEFEYKKYNCSLFQDSLFAHDLCVSSADSVEMEGYTPQETLHAAGLFDLNNQNILCGYNLFEKVYPASTTKIMTAYLALKYGNPDDQVLVSFHATDFNWDEVTCGLREGDTITLYDLICGLLLKSGNDCGTAIAEHISGSEEKFAELMNAEANAIGATGTHFVNPHGLHDENHYTTAYDLYLIFNQCIRDQRFIDIISMDSYTGKLTGSDGTVREEVWEPTNYYSAGLTDSPEGVKVLGGKTGTTDQAGNCVILYDEDIEENPYISVIMGADDKNQLYEEMNKLLDAGL